jgi:hypothetical protein
MNGGMDVKATAARSSIYRPRQSTPQVDLFCCAPLRQSPCPAYQSHPEIFTQRVKLPRCGLVDLEFSGKLADLLSTNPRETVACRSRKHKLTHTSYVFYLPGSSQVDLKGVKTAEKDKSKEGVSDKKSSSKNDTKKKGVKAEEVEKHVLTREEEELKPKSPGNTAHVSTSKANFSGLLLDNDTDDDDTDFFDDDQ